MSDAQSRLKQLDKDNQTYLNIVLSYTDPFQSQNGASDEEMVDLEEIRRMSRRKKTGKEVFTTESKQPEDITGGILLLVSLFRNEVV